MSDTGRWYEMVDHQGHRYIEFRSNDSSNNKSSSPTSNYPEVDRRRLGNARSGKQDLKHSALRAFDLDSIELRD